MSEVMRAVPVGGLAPCSRFFKTSTMPNTPSATATTDSPSVSSGRPRVKR